MATKMALVTSFLFLCVLPYLPLSAWTCTDPFPFNQHTMIPPPGEYNGTDTTPMTGCVGDSTSLTCGGSGLLGDGDPGSVDLDISNVLAWSETVDIVFTLPPVPSDRVQQVNLFFHNEPQKGVGLPPIIELHWSGNNPTVPTLPDAIPLVYTLLGNQDLSQSDERLRNVTLAVTFDDDIPDYRYFRVHFAFPETSQINTILLSEVELCGESVSVPVENITFLEGGDEVIQLGPVDDVVATIELSCTVANEGTFQFDWTFPPSVSSNQYHIRTADATRTSIVQISQLWLDNGGDYVCQANYSSGEGESASRTITLDLRGTLQPLAPTVMTVANQPVTLGCELYGYVEESEDIIWQFEVNDAQLQSDSVYTISVESGNRSLQHGGDSPEANILSHLTIQQPNSSHDGTYICAASGMIRTLNLDVNIEVHMDPTTTVPSQTQPPPTPDSSSSPSPQPPTSGESGSSGDDTSLGPIIGVVAGALVVAIIVVAIVIVAMYIRRKEPQPASHIYDYVEPPDLPPRRHYNRIRMEENAAYSHDGTPTHGNGVHASASSIQVDLNAPDTSIQFHGPGAMESSFIGSSHGVSDVTGSDAENEGCDSTNIGENIDAADPLPPEQHSTEDEQSSCEDVHSVHVPATDHPTEVTSSSSVHVPATDHPTEVTSSSSVHVPATDHPTEVTSSSSVNVPATDHPTEVTSSSSVNVPATDHPTEVTSPSSVPVPKGDHEEVNSKSNGENIDVADTGNPLPPEQHSTEDEQSSYEEIHSVYDSLPLPATVHPTDATHSSSVNVTGDAYEEVNPVYDIFPIPAPAGCARGHSNAATPEDDYEEITSAYDPFPLPPRPPPEQSKKAADQSYGKTGAVSDGFPVLACRENTKSPAELGSADGTATKCVLSSISEPKNDSIDSTGAQPAHNTQSIQHHSPHGEVIMVRKSLPRDHDYINDVLSVIFVSGEFPVPSRICTAPSTPKPAPESEDTHKILPHSEINATPVPLPTYVNVNANQATPGAEVMSEARSCNQQSPCEDDHPKDTNDQPKSKFNDQKDEHGEAVQSSFHNESEQIEDYERPCEYEQLCDYEESNSPYDTIPVPPQMKNGPTA